MSQSSARKIPATPGAPVKEESVQFNNRRILVVEDENEIAEGYKRILGSTGGPVVPLRRSSRSQVSQAEVPEAGAGFDISVASNAAAALKLVEESIKHGKPFAMGFFDVLLGSGIDGIELVKKIHEIDHDMYAVFVTAYSDRSVDSINSMLGEAMKDRWDYLNKPFSEGEILQKARNSVAHWNLRKLEQWEKARLGEAQQRLLEGERMAAVAAVARGVGHEFGNILVQIIGWAELSLNKDTQQMKHALETILKAAETASSILNRFKNLGRPAEPTQSHRLLVLQVALLEALDIMGHQLRTSNIKICFLKSDPVKAHGSHASFVQVFVNLIINSIHAMDGEGQIDFVLEDQGEWAEIRVIDHGPGIPDEHLDQVMQPFFTTKGDKGTGLGLAICREIIEIEHGGQFSVRNHPELGAEVVMRLPVQSIWGDKND